ncbi:MAG TPA: hypothetical protein DC049_02980, partial [Spirochaetia bacterium]|nr:hypothetical protein [Spirochaetia bacterium]
MESLKLLLEESKLLYPEFLGSYRFIRQNKESIKEIRAHIAACAELGIPLISIYSDDRRNKKNVTEDESDLLRRGLREASHFAADHNIILAWDLTAGQVYDDMESAMKFLTKLYRKNIFYRMDTWHIFSEAKMDPVLFFHMFKDLVVSVRCRSRDASQDVSGPLAASSCNYPEFLKSLVKNNYRGHI